MAKKSIARPGLIDEVIWIDSVGVGRWAPLSDHLPGHGDLYHRSIGYVVADTKDSLTLVQSYGGSGNYDNSVTIPKIALVRRRLKSK